MRIAATQGQYRQAEAIAQQQGRGLWNPNNPLLMMPWQFRSASLSLLGNLPHIIYANGSNIAAIGTHQTGRQFPCT